jgi:hypothetical protein
MLEGTRLINNILALARFIGVEFRYSDIDHCNQLSGSQQSKVARGSTSRTHPASTVIQTSQTRWMRDEFYSCYLHCVKGMVLTVSMLFRHSKYFSFFSIMQNFGSFNALMRRVLCYISFAVINWKLKNVKILTRQHYNIRVPPFPLHHFYLYPFLNKKNRNLEKTCCKISRIFYQYDHANI